MLEKPPRGGRSPPMGECWGGGTPSVPGLGFVRWGPRRGGERGLSLPVGPGESGNAGLGADEVAGRYPKKATLIDEEVFQAAGGKLVITLIGFCLRQAFHSLGYVTALLSLGILVGFWVLLFILFVECRYWGRMESDKPLWVKEALSGVGRTQRGEPKPKP